MVPWDDRPKIVSRIIYSNDDLFAPPTLLVSHMRILIVEDSNPLRRMFARLLTVSGFEVCEASDGQEAMEVLAGLTPDLVLTDLMMPRVDGVELIRRIRATLGGATLPIVAMTAVAGGCDRALEAGADRALTKPLDLETLLGCIGSYPSPV